MAPWTNKTGVAKAAAILATIALVSLGLCGANFVAAISFYGSGGGGSILNNAINATLMVGAWLEIAGIVIGVLGLIVVGIMALWRAANPILRSTKIESSGQDEEN